MASTAPADPIAAGVTKAELHCHLGGVLDPEMLRALRADGLDLGLDPAALEACYPVRSIADFLDRYSATIDPALAPRDVRLLPLLVQQVRRWRAQRVDYAEVFLGDLLFARRDLGELVELYRVFQATAQRHAGPELQVEIVSCVGRGSVERFERQAERIIALHAAGVVCGIAIAGLEEHPLEPARHVFDRLHDTGMGIEVHAGETRGPASVWDALRHARPHRIGHGLAIFADPALPDAVQRAGLHLEFCPTSNLALGCVARIADHPIAVAHRRGMSFSVNTDDPGAFGVSLTSELGLLETQFGFTAADFAAIHTHTVAAGFAPRGRRTA
jgi:adenosine deaminase